MDRVRVERPAEHGGESGSIVRRPAIDEPTLWSGISTIPAGAATGWHHHGTNTTVFYMLSGSLTVEHGEDPIEAETAETGDFVVVPAGAIHREIVPDDGPAEAVVMRFGDGQGPLVVDIEQ
ncbi:MAG: cupin domain-containing protein [Acidimicrobiia bacterium]